MEILFNDEVREAFRKVISCLIPNDNYNKEAFKDTVMSLEKVIKLEETNNLDWIVYNTILTQYKLTSLSKSFDPTLTKEIFMVKVEVNLYNIINNPKVDINKILEEEGIESSNDDNVNVSFLVTLISQFYDELSMMGTDTGKGLSYVDILAEKIISTSIIRFIQESAALVESGITKYRETYVGIDGFFKYMQKFKEEITPKLLALKEKASNTLVIKNLQDYNNFMQTKEGSQSLEGVAKWGIEPLDKVSPVIVGDVVSIIGDEGTGKTQLSVAIATNSIMQGKSIIYMVGESKKTKILHMIVANYIFKKYGLKFNWKELIEIDTVAPQYKAIFKKSLDELLEGDKENGLGRMVLQTKFTYETVYDEVKEIVEKNRDLDFGVVFIDHSNRLKSSGEVTEKGKLLNDNARVGYLYEKCIEIGDDFDVATIITNHTGYEATREINKGKSTGVRVGGTSSATTKDADVVILLSKNDELDAQKLLKFDIKKYREYDLDKKDFLVKKDFVCSNFIYSEDIQIKAQVSEEDFLSEVENLEDLV